MKRRERTRALRSSSTGRGPRAVVEAFASARSAASCRWSTRTRSRPARRWPPDCQRGDGQNQAHVENGTRTPRGAPRSRSAARTTTANRNCGSRVEDVTVASIRDGPVRARPRWPAPDVHADRASAAVKPRNRCTAHRLRLLVSDRRRARWRAGTIRKTTKSTSRRRSVPLGRRYEVEIRATRREGRRGVRAE